jgi:hypothetical protein
LKEKLGWEEKRRLKGDGWGGSGVDLGKMRRR